MRNFQVSLVQDRGHCWHLHPLFRGRNLEVFLGRGQLPQPLSARLPASRVLSVSLLPGGQQEVVVVVGGHEVQIGLRVRPWEDSLERPRLCEFLLRVDQHSDITGSQVVCNMQSLNAIQLSEILEAGVGVRCS